MPRDAPNEHDGGLTWIDTPCLRKLERSIGQFASAINGANPALEIDAVMHHVDLGRINIRVRAKNVGSHSSAHGDNTGSTKVGGALGPAGEGIAATQLLGLPGPHGLKAVSRDQMRNPMKEPSHVAGHVGVPGVRVHQISSGNILRDRKINAEGSQRRVGILQASWHVVARDEGKSRPGGGIRAWPIEAADVDFSALSQDSGKLSHMNAGAAVDVGWIFASEQIDTHGPDPARSEGMLAPKQPEMDQRLNNRWNA